MAAVWVNRGGTLFWVDEDSEEHKRLLAEGGFETSEGDGVPFGAQASVSVTVAPEPQPEPSAPLPESTEQPVSAPEEGRAPVLGETDGEPVGE